MSDEIVKLSPWKLSEDGERLIYTETSEIYKAYEDLFAKIFPGISLDPSTPQGQLIAALTESDTNTLDLIEKMANLTIFGGSGDNLDKWAFNLYRVIRKMGTPSTVTVTIYGTPNVYIPKGFTVSDGELNYLTEKDYQIGLNGEVDVLAVCSKISEKVSLAYTVDQIVTQQPGVNRCTNKSPSTDPVLIESDSSLYQRCLNFGAISRNATLNSLLSEIAQLEGVKKVNGYENYSKSQETFKGTLFEPHSFGIVVLGGSDEMIAEAIQRLKPPGPTMMGTTDVKIPVDYEVNIEDKEYNETYRFYRPTPLALQFKISIKLFNNSPANFDEIIKKALLSYVDVIPIGHYVNAAVASSYILKYIDNMVIIESLELGIKSQSLGKDDIELTFLQMATVALEDITVSAVEE